MTPPGGDAGAAGGAGAAGAGRAGGAGGGAGADLIIRGSIWTLAGDTGFGLVEALAVRGGRVVAAGTWREVESWARPWTRRLDVPPDAVVMPGITDAHLHLEDAALARTSLDLSHTTLLSGLAAVGAAHAARALAGDADGWIVGSGWSADAWGRWPTAADLDAVAPGRPVALWSHDHHSRLVSTEALRRAGIAARTADPPGGLIGRDEAGVPTGVLYEHAAKLVDRAIPRPSRDEIEAAVIAYAQELLALGVTGVHDPGQLVADASLRDGPELYRRMAVSGRLPIRVHGSIRDVQLDRAIELGLRSGAATSAPDPSDPGAVLAADRWRMGWLKLFADGAMGSRTAALLDPYQTEPGMPSPAGGPAGMLITTAEQLRSLVAQAAAAGIACQIHAIGDRAVREVLDVLSEHAAAAGAARMPLMQRIEHAQLVAPGDAERFGRAGIAVSVQPVHLASDALAARRIWGARTSGAFPLRSLLDAGAVVAFGTDAPVESPDPWPGIAIAVTRADPAWGPEARAPFHAEQAISLAEAIRAACVAPGVTAGQPLVGRLVPGSPADIAIVGREAVEEPVPPGGPLATTRPQATFVDGTVAYRSPAFERDA